MSDKLIQMAKPEDPEEVNKHWLFSITFKLSSSTEARRRSRL